MKLHKSTSILLRVEVNDVYLWNMQQRCLNYLVGPLSNRFFQTEKELLLLFFFF